MKHTFKVTFLILIIFLLTQFMGIFILYNYIDHSQGVSEGKTVFKDLPFGERPQLKEQTSYLPIILALLIGTGILFLLIKYQFFLLWKLWYLMAVILSLTISLGIFIQPLYAFFLSLFFGLWKVFRPNVLIHNFTEIFVYGGLAAIFVPVFNLWSINILLLLISVYDMYAVWKSKHMVFLAKSQAKANIFAGLLIPYSKHHLSLKMDKSNRKKEKGRTALLGGGDIGFPLIFTGVVLHSFGVWQSLIIPIFSGAALFLLLIKGNKDKFYPAMPFITLGCWLGLAVIWLISYFLGL